MSGQACKFHLVVGCDVHLELPPPPATVPAPFPNPFVGVIWDPIGDIVAEVVGALVACVADTPVTPGPVLVNGRPASTTGQTAMAPVGHLIIPPGISFARGFCDNEAQLVLGSKTVLMGGNSAVRNGEVALSCSDPVPLPTAMVMEGSPNVIVGGPPAIDFGAVFGMVGGLAMRTKWFAKKLHGIADKVLPKNWQRAKDLAHKTICFFTGHPVNVANGAVSTEAVDLELPGAIPIRFARVYKSGWCDRGGPLGFGWSHSYDERVWIERGVVVVGLGDGREIEFPTDHLADGVMRRGDRVFHPVDRMDLHALGELRWELRSSDGSVREFAAVPGESSADKDRGLSRLVAIRDEAGHRVVLSYDARARLERIVDAGGRVVQTEHDASGRLRRLYAPTSDGAGLRQHAEYRHDESGDLVEVVDALGQRWRLEYDRHALVRETDRNGLSFYFAYDGHGPFARCTRTWGDGGIYDHVITYDPKGLRTSVTNSLGETTSYRMNGYGVVVEVVHPGGAVTQREFDDRLWLTAEIDALGRATRYTHDDRGNTVMEVGPDRAVTKTRYDDRDRPVEVVETTGATWGWRYDGQGQLVARTDPMGRVTRYEHEAGQLVGVVDPAGQRTALAWDRAGNMIGVTTPDGARTSWQHDGLGRAVRREDARGNAEVRAYDALGRVVRVDEADGNISRIEYDAEGNVVRAQDRLRDVAFAYEGLRWMASRTVAGNTVRFRHDSEGQLVGVINERGLEHGFELDPQGFVVAEVAFDGLRKVWTRDLAGRPVKMVRPGVDRATTYEHDAAGRLTAVTHADGGRQAYGYDAAGRVVRAENEHAVVELVRDVLGRVIEERTSIGERTWKVESKRDHAGRRIGLRSSLGLDVTFERNAMGDVVRVAQTGRAFAGWEASFVRDVLGAEIDRQLPGGARSYWWRDAVGRPTQHHVGRPNETHRLRKYAWGVDERLRAIVEEGRGETAYEHDGRGWLVKALGPDGGEEGLYPDEVGNTFASGSRDDRGYGAAGEILTLRTPDGEAKYAYDDEGRLASRRDADGGHWSYHFDDADRLAQVDRPDGTAVAMAYDAFGRRLWKNHLGRKTCWVWDGDVPLHEWCEAAAVPERRRTPEERARSEYLAGYRQQLASLPDAEARWKEVLARDEGFARLHAELRYVEEHGAPKPPAAIDSTVVTWLFDPGSFAPMARLTATEAHAIICDHVDAPLAVLDTEGALATRLDLDLRGRASIEGRADLCPFRFAGQYADRETGLHYNRHRHYDPDTAQYISRDPLGLRAGLRTQAYVADPLVEIDPLGLASSSPGGCGGTPPINRQKQAGHVPGTPQHAIASAIASPRRRSTMPPRPTRSHERRGREECRSEPRGA